MLTVRSPIVSVSNHLCCSPDVHMPQFKMGPIFLYVVYPCFRLPASNYSFYRTMLCIRGTSHGPVSVCLSHVGVLLKRLNESSWFRTRRTSSFCTVAWQLARFQLTRRIARSRGDSWASCIARSSSSSCSHSRRGPSRRCTTMSTVDSTSPEVSNRTRGVVS